MGRKGNNAMRGGKPTASDMQREDWGTHGVPGLRNVAGDLQGIVGEG